MIGHLVVTLVAAWALWTITGRPRSRKDAALKVVICLLFGAWVAAASTAADLNGLDPNAGQRM